MRAGMYAWQVVYFTVATTWGYIALKDTDWLPWWMGGPADGHFTNSFVNPPFLPYPQIVYEYSLWTFGYHFGGLFMHTCVDERNRSFEEYLIHHIAAVALFFSFIYSNTIGIGATIAWIHDIADIFVSITKLLNSTHHERPTVVVFAILIIVWFVTRLVWLPIFIYHIWFYEAPENLQHLNFISLYAKLNAIFLLAM